VERNKCGGEGGRRAGGGVAWSRWEHGERECRERDLLQKKKKKTREEAGFFVNFGLDFLLHQAINSASIYRRWKRAILSIPGKNFSLDSVGKDPNRWFKVASLSCQICRKRLPALTSSRRPRWRRVVIHPATFTWGCRGTVGDPFRASCVRFDGEIKQ